MSEDTKQKTEETQDADSAVNAGSGVQTEETADSQITGEVEEGGKTERDAQSSADPVDEEKPEKMNVRREVLSWVRTFVITIGVALFIIFVVLINAIVPSGSMENTIMTGDRLIGFRFSYWFSSPQRGDIILFKYPVDESKTYVKRVIGLPGETVTIKNSKIYINHSKKPLKESYLKEKWVIANDGYTFKVPKNCYFVMGDNRNNSEDSRFWAEDALESGVADSVSEAKKYTYVKKSQIKGRAIFVYFRHPHLLTDRS